jgi:hypothetical protein
MTVTFGQLQERILYESNRLNVQEYGVGANNAILTSIKYLEYNHPWLFQKQIQIQVNLPIFTLGANPITVTNGSGIVSINVGGDLSALQNSTFISLTGVSDPSGFIGGIPTDALNASFPIASTAPNTINIFVNNYATSNAVGGGNAVVIAGSANIIPLPDDFSSVIAFNYIWGYQVFGLREGFQGVTYAELSDYYNLITQTGQPMKWAILNNNIYIYPSISLAQIPNNPPINQPIFNLIYNYKDVVYPSAPNDVSIWFGNNTVDMCRYKALEVFYRDTLQSPEIGMQYASAFNDFQKNLITRNNYRSVSNLLTI